MIRVGAKYSSPTAKYGGARVVDAVILRRNGQEAVAWTRAAGAGHRHGVSLLDTFARWARAEEPMTEKEQAAHQRRAQWHAENSSQYGPLAAHLLDTKTPRYPQ